MSCTRKAHLVAKDGVQGGGLQGGAVGRAAHAQDAARRQRHRIKVRLRTRACSSHQSHAGTNIFDATPVLEEHDIRHVEACRGCMLRAGLRWRLISWPADRDDEGLKIAGAMQVCL